MGITDEFAEYTQSYRNLTQLQIVTENNGYWFEGEQMGEGPLAASNTRRRIKMHNDVELVVGDFIWYGCFESIQISQDAESPFLARFQIEFTAWKERFRATSPYWNNIQTTIERGHSYSAYESLVNNSQAGTSSTLLASSPTSNFPNLIGPSNTSMVSSTSNNFPLLPTNLGGSLNTPPVSPAVMNEQNGILNPPTQGMSPTLGDFSPTPQYVIGSDSLSGEEFWQA
jgi:hypothetical protein